MKGYFSHTRKLPALLAAAAVLFSGNVGVMHHHVQPDSHCAVCAHAWFHASEPAQCDHQNTEDHPCICSTRPLFHQWDYVSTDYHSSRMPNGPPSYTS
ncbi:MAG TPA: hypothetical protein VKQ10_01645 [Spirochaetota bacterium]|nr:hypothetical protein [Spirochaetota bacterium]